MDLYLFPLVLFSSIRFVENNRIGFFTSHSINFKRKYEVYKYKL